MYLVRLNFGNKIFYLFIFLKNSSFRPLVWEVCYSQLVDEASKAS